MTASHATATDAPTSSGSSARQISVLLYSDDVDTRQQVILALGRVLRDRRAP